MRSAGRRDTPNARGIDASANHQGRTSGAGTGERLDSVTEFLVDKNFNEHIIDGLTRRDSTLDFTLARDVDLAAVPDPALLEWAAQYGLIVLTHDRATMPVYAHARVAAGLPMPGVFLVADEMPVGEAIEQLLIAAHCLTPEECDNLVLAFSNVKPY